MKINSYLSFGGNCAEALNFYEKAFNVKAKIMRYGDAPAGDGYQPDEATKNLVMHAQFSLGSEEILFCDVPPGSDVNFGNGLSISVGFDNAGQAKSAFDALKVGGVVDMDLQETFWSKCFGTLTDKFGVNWMITLDSSNHN
ncbi:MAG: VOC family protein [Clostridiales bacterium]|nr:VOC family protein [Clostridiales bacterium]